MKFIDTFGIEREVENAYARPSTVDKDNEYRYLHTECGNWWYSIVSDPMRRNGCLCPKCGKVVKVVIPC